MWQHEDFLRYYKIPEIKNYTNVSTIKFILIRFMLLQSEFKFQTQDSASNIKRHDSDGPEQSKKDQQKVLEAHRHYDLLNLSLKDMTKQSKLLNDVIGTVREIAVLAKYSPNLEQLLGSMQSNLECDDNDDNFEQATGLSKTFCEKTETQLEKRNT